MKWAYGVTTVPQRADDLLPRTLASLHAAGFDTPRLFVDGAASADAYRALHAHKWPVSDIPITTRYPTIKAYGNWVLALAELYIREPTAERYAMFQDDMVAYKNLRRYLEKVPYPERGYCNLYSFRSNEGLAPASTGWYLSNQYGRGAVALMFSREAVLTLLTHQHMVERPMHVDRGTERIDGGVVTAMAKAGWKEYVHNPGLVQHTGDVSTLAHPKYPKSQSFRGEGYDALAMIH